MSPAEKGYNPDTSNVIIRNNISPLDEYYHRFHVAFDKDNNIKKFTQNIRIPNNLSADITDRVKELKDHWDIFISTGFILLVTGYEIIIDIRNNQSIAARNPRYGIHEAPVMQNPAKKLLGSKFINEDRIYPWPSAITLAPKFHQ